MTATFNTPPPNALTVSKAGTGTGTVTSNPAGINCGSDCSENYTSGTVVTLTVTPASGSTFVGWSGACTGTGTCQVTMTQARVVTATFNKITTYSLTVSKAGTGNGTVTSNPTGINCGTDCSENYTSGTTVTLTATPANGSVFTGWSGACTGTGTCQVTMSQARSVTATFNTPTYYTLMVIKAGSGTGTVTSSPSGITCGSDCSESYTSGTTVTLAATPGSGSTFTGWSGACTGTGTCQLTMSQVQTVTATFTITFPLTVTKAGAGSGTVTSSPAGITCGSDCSESYASGKTVTLTAKPATGSTLAAGAAPAAAKVPAR